ncbi:Acetylornithine deacetylase [Symmachiella macrocystis]|uniref:Acetylornithine deacetylase n=1 Tax=Symmachiella macrocystis TaxID=2527985 RepID=A0A5C6BKY3_9PLAN|nr:M20 family metallopeptidase [Symmachiella macrocystis]TWU12171.1 Acetylornithine deacetylase [Symmachiella macrocystis]
MHDPVELLQSLVAIPSVNPMGRNVSGPEYGEARMTAFLEDWFATLGVTTEKVEVLPGRFNLLARYDAGPDRRTILLDAHQDTVPVDGMTIPPFEPVIKEDKLFGRGACDVKGGMAAMLAAFARLVTQRPAEAANVVMSCSCEEEAEALGVKDLVKLWSEPGRGISSLNTAPEVAVVAEPTDLDVVVAHRGATRWKLRTTGRACHSSRPDDGVNAIYKMGQVLSGLEAFAAHLKQAIPAHPLCGPATISVGRIEGGLSVNTVPDRCEIEIDRRVIPGEDGAAVIADCEEYLRKNIDVDFEMLPPWITGISLSDEHNGELADRMLESVAAVAGPHKKVGVAYGTNASRIAASGVPSIVCGPGSINQAHTEAEWININELRQAADIYYRFCAGE